MKEEEAEDEAKKTDAKKEILDELEKLREMVLKM